VFVQDQDKVKATTGDDGGDRSVSADALAAAKNEVKYIADGLGSGVSSNRLMDESENVLFCEWDGQSSDGLKHDSDEAEASPFDGALDTRVRYADMVLNETMMIAVLAALRARVRVIGTETGDNRHAAILATVQRWLQDNHFGADYIRALSRWVRFAYGDRPAISLMEVHYQREMMMEMARVSLVELGEMYVSLVTDGMSDEEIQQRLPMLQEDFEALRILMLDPDGYLAAQADGEALPDAAEVLMQFFPYLKMKRAKRVVKEVRAQFKAGNENPVFEFPRQVVKCEGPVITPRRSCRDWFVPDNTSDFQDARVYYIREWLTEAELRSRVVSMNYSEKFVDAVLERGDEQGGFELAGKTAFGFTWTDGKTERADKDAYRGLFEIITQYRRAVNEDFIPGVYALTFHYDCDVVAKDEELVDYPHGDYPGVVLSREVLTDRMMDSRGVPDIAGPLQGVMKEFVDACGNNAKLNTIPAFQTTGRRSSGRIKLGMLEENKLRRGGEIKPILTGQYPAIGLKMFRELQKMGNEYFGRPDIELSPALVQLHREWIVVWFLAALRDVWRMILQNVQEYMGQEMIQRIAGAKMKGPSPARAEIRGGFDIRLEFDGRDFDFQFVAEKAKLFRDVLMGMDTKATGKWNEVLRSLMESVDPVLADRVLVDEEDATKSELDDEAQNIMKLSAGIPVVPVEAGQNFPLRLQAVQEWAQLNGEDIQKWSPQKQQMLEERMKHLAFMTQQIQNAQTGRVGV
jgi:hypothetical protein